MLMFAVERNAQSSSERMSRIRDAELKAFYHTVWGLESFADFPAIIIAGIVCKANTQILLVNEPNYLTNSLLM